MVVVVNQCDAGFVTIVTLLVTLLVTIVTIDEVECSGSGSKSV